MEICLMKVKSTRYKRMMHHTTNKTIRVATVESWEALGQDKVVCWERTLHMADTFHMSKDQLL